MTFEGREKELDREFRNKLLIGVAVVIVAFGYIIAFCKYADRRGCAQRWEASGRATRWDPWGDCRVEIDPGSGVYYPEGMLKRIEIKETP